MPDPVSTVADEAPAPPEKTAFTGKTPREKFGFLHNLVTVALIYLLLFSSNSDFTTDTLQLVILGLLLVTLVLFWLPTHLWELRWFLWVLVLGDTALGAYIFYLSGNADAGLYCSLFLIIMIAAYAPSLARHYTLSVAVIVAYVVALSVLAVYEGTIAENLLLRGPVLLIMAIFYGSMLEKKGASLSPSPAS